MLSPHLYPVYTHLHYSALLTMVISMSIQLHSETPVPPPKPPLPLVTLHQPPPPHLPPPPPPPLPPLQNLVPLLLKLLLLMSLFPHTYSHFLLARGISQVNWLPHGVTASKASTALSLKRSGDVMPLRPARLKYMICRARVVT